jgi:hypothetical protein
VNDTVEPEIEHTELADASIVNATARPDDAVGALGEFCARIRLRYPKRIPCRIPPKAPIMTIIKVPDELAHEIDRLAGAKKRSAFATDVLWREVRRNRQREALRASAGSWNAVDHPELARGGAAYIEEIRAERDGRFEDALDRHQR